MSDTCRLFPPFGDPWPSCLLPSQSYIVPLPVRGKGYIFQEKATEGQSQGSKCLDGLFFFFFFLMYVCVCLYAQCPTLCRFWNCSLPGSSVHEDSPGKNIGMDCHTLLQGFFPTQDTQGCIAPWMHMDNL